MRLLRALRAQLSYANVMATIAVFVALGGGAYAVTLPRNSVGAAQLKRGSVGTRAIQNHSVKGADLDRGLLPKSSAMKAEDAAGPDAGTGTVIKSASIRTVAGGPAYAFATLRDPFVSCGAAPCEARWGIVVDGRPVARSGLLLRAGAGEGDGRTYYMLYGATQKLGPGSHTVQVVRATSGAQMTVGELGVQLGAIGLGR